MRDESDRLCARVGCAEIAAATLTADYDGRTMAVGPLSPLREPPALDLCARHRDTLSPPDGWELIRHDADRTGGSGGLDAAQQIDTARQVDAARQAQRG